jgi:hypothetical protein
LGSIRAWLHEADYIVQGCRFEADGAAAQRRGPAALCRRKEKRKPVCDAFYVRPRLTKDECDHIAERLATSLAQGEPDDVLRRCLRGSEDGPQQAEDGETGLSFRHLAQASQMPDGRVVVGVTVWPEPPPKRVGGLLRGVAEAVDGIRWHAHSGHALKVVGSDAALLH